MFQIRCMFLIALAWGAFRGFVKGFILQIVTLLALMLGIWASIHFSDGMAHFLTRNLDITGRYLPVLSFLLIFILVIIVAHLIGLLMTRLFELTPVGWLNRVGGIFFGILKMAFIVSVILSLQNRMKEKVHILPEKQIKSSLLYEPVASIAPAVFPHLRLLAFHQPEEEE